MVQKAWKEKFFKIFQIFLTSLAFHTFLILILVLLVPTSKTIHKEVPILIIKDTERPKNSSLIKTTPKPKFSNEQGSEPGVEIPDEDTFLPKEKEPFSEGPVTTTPDPIESKPKLEIFPVEIPGIEIPLPNKALISRINNGPGSGSSGIPEQFKGRLKKEKNKKVKKYGGGKATEHAVGRALKWLQHHQEKDGYWDIFKYGASYHQYHGKSPKLAVTAMATLAFLGAGNSERYGEYSGTVRKSVRWMTQYMKTQLTQPNLNPSEYLKRRYDRYAWAVTLQCLSEVSAMGASRKTKTTANKLAEFFIKLHQSEKLAWDRGEKIDLFVLGWIALGLKQAQLADLKVMKTEAAHLFFDHYREYIEKVTDEKTGKGKYTPIGKYSQSMTWVGMFQRQFLQYPKNDSYLKKASYHLHKAIPELLPELEIKNSYQVYFANLAAFQQGGKLWEQWNKRMRKVLLSTQRKGDPKLLGGSWDVSGELGVEGRVMMTSVYALCLEVYYRYNI